MDNKGYEEDVRETSHSAEKSAHEVNNAEIDYSKARVFPQVMCALAAAIGAFCLGTTLGWSSPAQPQLENNSTSAGLHVTSDEMSWVASLVTLGALIGGLTGGLIMDFFGRKNTLILLTLPYVLGWLLITYAQNAAMLYAGRVISGIAGGVTSVAAPAYIGETAMPPVRGTLGSLFQLFICLGIMITSAAGIGLTWRWLAQAAGIIPAIMLVALLFVPETPVYLIKNGKTAEAYNSLRFLRGKDFAIEAELAELEATSGSSNPNNASKFSDILKKWALRPLLVALGLMAFQQLCGINAAIFFTADIFKSAGSSLDPGICAVIIDGVQVAATGASMVVVDRFGRKLLLLLSMGLMCISMAALGSFFYVKEYDPETADTLGWLPLTSLIIFIAAFSIGFGPLPWLMMGEVLPAKVKGNAASIATFLNWFLAFLVTKFFVDIQAAITPAGSFWLFCGFAFLGVLFVLFTVPETKGKSSEQIAEYFNSTRRDSDSSINGV